MFNLKKNENVICDIIDMSYDGLGISRVDNVVIFVKGGLIGDKVEAIITKVTKNIVYAKVINIIEPSQYRVEPLCKIQNRCGGCMIMSLDYKKQIQIKTNFVKNCLLKIGNFDTNFIEKIFEGIITFNDLENNLYLDDKNFPIRYRNKLQIPFCIRNGKIVYGFYALNTHYIIECDNCFVGFENYKKIIDSIVEFLEKEKIPIYDGYKNGYVREIVLRTTNNTNQVSLTFIVFKKNNLYYKKIIDFVPKLISNFSFIKTITININEKTDNVIFGDKNEIIYGDGYIMDEMFGLKFRISTTSFYQVNKYMTQKLYSEVLNNIENEIEQNNYNKNEITILDLYCGIGTMTLLFSKYAKKVYGIEVVKDAIIDAKENCKINNIENVEFICNDLSNIKSDFKEQINKIKNVNILVVDPPRKGLSCDTIEYINNLSPENIIYVSCDPATLSRDLKILCDDTKDSYYHIKKIKCIDMFPHTMHVETVTLLSRIEE